MAVAARVRTLLAAGLLDSFGLSLGWTAFILIAVGRGGLAAAGEYNAAMLVGVVGSAPVTGWIASRVDGRVLLTGTGSVELVLRVGTLAGLLVGWPAPLLAAGVVAMNVAAWSGYAGMRAEVAAVDPGPRSLTRYAVAIAAVEAVGAGVAVMNVAAWSGYAGMRAEVAAADPGPRSLTRYAVAIAAVEALGASVAALLPITAAGQLGGAVTAGIMLVYGSSVIPQFLIARTSVVRSGREVRSDQLAAEPAGSTLPAEPAGVVLPAEPAGAVLPTEPIRPAEPHRLGYAGRHRRRPPVPLPMPFGRQVVALVGGALIMLVASGPVTLGTALAQQLYGHAAVGFAAMAFSAGCLLASPAAAALDRLGLPGQLRWLVWGAGMLLGWLAAPWQLAGLLGAQLVSAVAITAFQGEMDATVSQAADPSRVTSALAWSAAVRACGSAVAVRMLPALVLAPSIGVLSAAATAALLSGGLIVLAAAKVSVMLGRAAGRQRQALTSAFAPASTPGAVSLSRLPAWPASIDAGGRPPAAAEPALAGASASRPG